MSATSALTEMWTLGMSRPMSGPTTWEPLATVTFAPYADRASLGTLPGNVTNSPRRNV